MLGFLVVFVLEALVELVAVTDVAAHELELRLSLGDADQAHQLDLGVLLKRRRNDLLRGLPQPRIHDLHPRVPQGTGDDFRTAIVAVLTKLDYQNPGPPALALGSRVSIFWPAEKTYYPGVVVGLLGGKVKVEYDDGDKGTYDLAKEVRRLEK